eukprot:1134682-Pyramimonas_sp.AAC.1
MATPLSACMKEFDSKSNRHRTANVGNGTCSTRLRSRRLGHGHHEANLPRDRPTVSVLNGPA